MKPSKNLWDWLGNGAYFWEQDPNRALSYAIESSQGKQFNKVPIKTPCVLGAIIELGNCLNLVESTSLEILTSAFLGLKKVTAELGTSMQYIYQSNRK